MKGTRLDSAGKRMARRWLLLGLFLLLAGGCTTPPIETTTPDVAPYELTLEKSLGAGFAEAAAWAPNGAVFAVATSLQVDLYDAQKLELRTTLKTDQWNQAIAYSPNGKLLAIGANDGAIQVWDTGTGKRLYTLTRAVATPTPEGRLALAFSQDSQKLAAAFDRKIYIWEADGGRLVNEFSAFTAGINSLSFSQDGRMLLTAGKRGIYLREVSSGHFLQRPISGSGEIAGAFLQPGDKQFVAVSFQNSFSDSSVGLGSIASGDLIENHIAAGTGRVISLAANPGQVWIALNTTHGIAIWDLSMQQVAFSLPGEVGHAQSIAISPDGERLLSIGGYDANGNGTVRLWDLASRELLRTFEVYSLPPGKVVFSSDRKQVAIAGMTGGVEIRNTKDWQLAQVLDGDGPIAFSPEGHTLALMRADTFVLANAETGEFSTDSGFHCPGASAVTFRPDGRAIAFGGGNCELQIQPLSAGSAIKMDQAPAKLDPSPASLAFTIDEKKLVAAGIWITTWDAKSGVMLQRVQAPSEARLAASPDGRYVAFTSIQEPNATKTVSVLDAASSQSVFTIETLQKDIKGMAFSTDGRTLAIGGERLELWDVWAGRPLARTGALRSKVTGLAFSPDGEALMAVLADGAVQQWRIQTRQGAEPGAPITPTSLPTLPAVALPRATAADIEGPLSQLGEIGKGLSPRGYRSPDGGVVAVVDQEGLKWFDGRTLEQLGAVDLPADMGAALLFSADGRKVLVDNHYAAWLVDLARGQVVGSLQGNVPMTGFRFTRNGSYLAYLATRGHGSYLVNLWNVSQRRPAFSNDNYFQPRLRGIYQVMSSPAISPDGRLVAAGSSDRRAYIWDLRSGKTLFVLEGHVDWVTGVDFSPDGNLLASGSRDGTIRLWSVTTGQLVRVITGFADAIQGVEFSADGRFLRAKLETPRYGPRDKTVYQFVDLIGGAVTSASEPIIAPDPFEIMQYQQGYSSASSSIYAHLLFSPDGRALALAGSQVQVWDVSMHRLLSFLQSPSAEAIRGMAFNANGTRLAVTQGEGLVLAWDTRTGKQLFSRRTDVLTGATIDGEGSIPGSARGNRGPAEQGLAFSPHDSWLAFGNGNRIEVWDIEKSERIASMAAQKGSYITQVSFSADGKRLYAVLNRNEAAQVWDAQTWTLIRSVDLPPVDPLAYTAVALNGHLFARNNGDREGHGWIELWDLDTDDYGRIETVVSENEPLRFSPDGRFLLAGNQGQLTVWHTSTGQPAYAGRWTGVPIGSALSPDNQILAAEDDAGKAILYDFRLLASDSGGAVTIPRLTPTPIVLAWPVATPTLTPPAPPASPGSVISPANTGQLHEVARFSDGTVERVAWSPRGDAILTAGSMGAFEYQVQPSSGRLTELARLVLGGWGYDAVSLPDGRTLAVGLESGRVLVRDFKTRKVLANLPGGGQPAFSPDGSMLAYLDPSGDLAIWNIPARRALATLRGSAFASLEWPVFSPDGLWLAAVQSPTVQTATASSVRVWDARTGAIVNALGGPDSEITDLSFSADGKFVTGAAGGAAWIWDVRPGISPEKIEVYHSEERDGLVYTGAVTAAALSPDDQIIAVGTSERTIRMYNRQTQALLLELKGHASPINHLRFSPGGGMLLSVDRDGIIIVWNSASGEQLARLDAHSGAVRGLLFRTDRNLAAWGSGVAWQIRPSDQALVHSVQIGTGILLAASPTRDLLAVYDPFHVSLWDAQGGRLIRALDARAQMPGMGGPDDVPTPAFSTAAFSPDGSRLVIGGTGGLWLYETGTKKLLSQVPGKDAQKVFFSPDSQSMLASVDGQFGPLAWYGAKTGQLEFTPQPAVFGQAALSADGHWLAAASPSWERSSSLVIYDMKFDRLYTVVPFEEHEDLVSVAFNPAGDIIAVGMADGQILLVDFNELEVVAKLSGHRGAVEHLAFSPDGRMLVSASADGTIRTWEVR